MPDPFSSGLPPDLLAQAERERRRQALAQALMQQSLQPQPTIKAGRFIVPQGAAGPIGQIGLAAIGGTGMHSAGEALRGVGETYNKRLVEGVESYMRQRQGTPEQPVAEGLEGPPVPARAPDPRGAATSAIASGIGPLQKLGFADVQAMNKNVMTLKDWLPMARYFDPKSVVTAAQTGDPRSLQLKPEIKQHEGQFYDFSDPSKPRLLADLTRVWTPETRQGPSGPIVGQVQAGTNKFDPIDKAPKINIGGPKAGAEAIFKEGAQAVSKIGEQARAAMAMQEALREMESLDKRGIFSNVTSGPAEFMANLATAMGGRLTPQQLTQMRNTQAFDSVAVGVWQGLVSQFGGNRGVTKEEAERIMTMIPLAKNDPGARQEIYRILSNSAKRQVGRFNEASDALMKAVAADKPELWQQHFRSVFAPQGPNIPPGPQPADPSKLVPLPGPPQ